jgi:hypothetical protein
MPCVAGERMTAADALRRGQESFRRRSWAEAYAQLSAADRDAPFESEDLEQLAVAAFQTGRARDSVEVWARAHRAWARLARIGEGRCLIYLGQIRSGASRPCCLLGHRPDPGGADLEVGPNQAAWRAIGR